MTTPHLLVIDDDEYICQLVKEVAQSCHYEVSVAHDEATFVTIYNNKKLNIDIILLDLQLGDKDGVELLRFLGKDAFHGSIILFGGIDRQTSHTAEQLGKTLGLTMSGCISKPVSVADITYALRMSSNNASCISYEKLREAIENFHLCLHYQPQIDLSNRAVIGMEALVRWQPPSKEIIFPDAFIPVAESTNLIIPLTFWVIEEAFKQSVIWHEQGLPLKVSINLSAKMLTNLLLPDKIQQIAEKYHVDCQKITFEITETAVMGQSKIFMDILARLRLKMFSLSVDNFGTGYSSLLELYRLPFNELKVDKSFIIGIADDEDSQIITEATIHLAQRLGLKTVIEGIETQKAYDMIQGFGADYVQGYFIAKPMTSDKVAHWLKENNPFTPYNRD